MITLKAEVQQKDKRQDNTYNVKIRLTYKRQVRRVSTSIYVTSKDITRSFKIKNPIYLQKIEVLLQKLRGILSTIDIESEQYSLDDIVSILKTGNINTQPIDFISFSKEWIEETTIKGKKNYISALNSFVKFLGKDTLSLKQLTPYLLHDYMRFLEEEKRKRYISLVEENKRIPSCRTISLYMGSLRHLYKELQSQYSIHESPFDTIKIPKQEVTRKRALFSEEIRSIYNLPYRNSRYDLAKDCFILSYCLMGMNSVDLYNCPFQRGDTIEYNRTKTKDRRSDKARMVVQIPSFIIPILEKYKDKSHERMFVFHKLYSSESSFNRALNIGLKQIGSILDIPDLEFYAARHSWATIALNKCGIDKYTVHSALNHVEPSMRVTDIYIERDFTNENKANAKVINYTFNL